MFRDARTAVGWRQETVNRQARQSVDEKDGARLLALRSLQMTKEVGVPPPSPVRSFVGIFH